MKTLQYGKKIGNDTEISEWVYYCYLKSFLQTYLFLGVGDSFVLNTFIIFPFRSISNLINLVEKNFNIFIIKFYDFFLFC